MTIRETLEQWEKEYLSPYATLSINSKGRAREENQCDIRPVFQRDRDRILHCKAFRRLKDKTQVFLSPEGDHYRTRLTHTLEVSQNARTLAKALKLNEELAEAIALGHDLGHTPFGHAGERALNRVCPLGFIHSEQSVRMVERIEKNGKGLNLTYEVKDGMLNHQTSGTPHTLEGKVVRLSDKIAYIHHDMDDAVRAGILKESDVPLRLRELLGDNPSDRLDTFIHDIVTNSTDKNDICMSEEIGNAVKEM
nr:deoxyguanosinetriphosphate triphosphohydrolase [Lachnospiraceae bacterium]